MYSDQSILLLDPRSHLERVSELALALLNRVIRARKAVLSADFLEDKIDALSDLVSVSTAFTALGIAIETDNPEIAEVARSLGRC